eukprot:14064056-Alexandrium_andersonii.AAC.1
MSASLVGSEMCIRDRNPTPCPPPALVIPVASEAFRSHIVFDSTQSWGWHSMRNDGLIPTMATGAEIWVAKWCRRLTPLGDVAPHG